MRFILPLILLFAICGCKSTPTNDNVQATGTHIVQAETYINVAIEQATAAVKELLKKALAALQLAAESNDKAGEDLDAAIEEIESLKADLKHLKSDGWYRAGQFVRGVIRFLKWMLIGWSALGLLGGILRFTPLAPVGWGMWMVFKGVNAFVLGLIPKGAFDATGAGLRWVGRLKPNGGKSGL